MRELRGFADGYADGLPQCPTHEKYAAVVFGARHPEGHDGTSCQIADNWELQSKPFRGRADSRRRMCQTCVLNSRADLFVPPSRLFTLAVTHANEYECGIARSRADYLPHELEAIVLVRAEGDRLDAQERKKNDGN